MSAPRKERARSRKSGAAVPRPARGPGRAGSAARELGRSAAEPRAQHRGRLGQKPGAAVPRPARGPGASEERSAAEPREHRTGPRIRLVAVDGPAGAGKSSASRALAHRLGFTYVDTGAMYRAVGVLAHERGIAPEDDEALGRLVADLTFEFAGDGERLLVAGRDLSAEIRRPAAGELASRVSTCPVVRARLVALQRALGAAGGVVMEGRDIGTVVFPAAPVKLYLTADPATRARRRAVELRGRGEAVDEAALARELAERDRRDAGRAHSPLRPAADAVVLDTTRLSLDAVVDVMERIVQSRGI